MLFYTYSFKLSTTILNFFDFLFLSFFSRFSFFNLCFYLCFSFHPGSCFPFLPLPFLFPSIIRIFLVALLYSVYCVFPILFIPQAAGKMGRNLIICIQLDSVPVPGSEVSMRPRIFPQP